MKQNRFFEIPCMSIHRNDIPHICIHRNDIIVTKEGHDNFEEWKNKVNKLTDEEMQEIANKMADSLMKQYHLSLSIIAYHLSLSIIADEYIKNKGEKNENRKKQAGINK